MYLCVALFAVFAGARPVVCQTVWQRDFRLRSSGETVLLIAASTPGTSWAEAGREAAVLTLFVDDRYSQDVVLFGGDRVLNYRVMLGGLNRGWHRLRVEQNAALSARDAGQAKVRSSKIVTLAPGSPGFYALASAPILYARPNTVGRFSDVPLLMYYETISGGERRTVRYSVIFSNEDGGTRTASLMARWGRATDIEWAYEFDRDRRGETLDERLQGVNHKTRAFSGRKEGTHPLLIVASDNNNFGDEGQSGMRFAPAPVFFDGRRHSREAMMDRNPWTYRIMTEELKREHKLVEQAPPASALTETPAEERIDDPRNYLYIEAACRLKGAALSFEVNLKGDPSWYSSDLGQPRLRIDRNGYFRTAIRLPGRIKPTQLDQLSVRCSRGPTNAGDYPRPECVVTDVSTVFLLDPAFSPGPSLASLHHQIRLAPEASAKLLGKRPAAATR
ncbi:MAG TPA: hypothetical protein VFV34_18140 [Blastocatellia bacterium]|nr:hypothetical protein [Blastocatellia bacterium]